MSILIKHPRGCLKALLIEWANSCRVMILSKGLRPEINLFKTYQIWKEGLKAIGQDFRDNLIANITQGNWAIINNLARIWPSRDKRHISSIRRGQHDCIIKEKLDNSTKVVTNIIP